MEKVSVMVARGSRKRTNMVIDFGSSPAKKKVEEALVLPALEDEKWTGEHMNEDLDDKVFGLANRADTGGNKSSRNGHAKLIRSARSLGAKKLRMSDGIAGDDGELGRSKRKPSRQQRSLSDDENLDSLCNRNFKLKTPNFTVRKPKKNKKKPSFSVYQNGNIASPFMSPQWMVPHRRSKRNQTPLSRNLNKCEDSPGLMYSTTRWPRLRTATPRTTPRVTAKVAPRSAATTQFSAPKPKLPIFSGEQRATKPRRGSVNSRGSCSPSTPRTPQDSWSDVENDSVSAPRSPELELISRDSNGHSFCIEALKKVSPAETKERKNSWRHPVNSSQSSMETDLEDKTSEQPSSQAESYETKSSADSYPSVVTMGEHENSEISFQLSSYTPQRPQNGDTGRNPDVDAMFTGSKASLKPPLHSSPPLYPLETFLSPDPNAFDSSGLRSSRRTPSSACPPTPVARPRIHRSNSLGQTKLLASAQVSNDFQSVMKGKIMHGKKFSQNFLQKKLIGEGSFFKVFRVFVKQKNGRRASYALKISKEQFRSKNHRAMYLQEFELVKSIPNHENVVKYLAAWQEDSHLCVVMEHCRCSLSRLVSIIRVTEKFFWNVIYQLSQALHHIHKHGILHMDVKPGNVLYGVDKVLKLADFGQAIRIDRRKQMLDGCEGDSKYMAPELMQNNAIPTEAADVFSLGLLMVEITTREPLPSEGEKWRDLRRGRAREHLLGTVSRSLEAVILQMLNPQTPRRPSPSQLATIAMKQIKKIQA